MKRKIIPPIPDRENHGSYLRKRKGSNFQRIFGDTNTRWFFIEFKNDIFGYKNKENDKKMKRIHQFSDFIAVKEHKDTNSKNKSNQWKFGLEIELMNKRYLLFAQTEEIQKRWIYELKIILRLVPESFPLIEKRIFQFAVDFYQKPYLEGLRREKEEKEIKIKKEKEEKIRKMKEEKEKRENEEKLRLEEEKRQLEEEKLRLEEEEKRKKLIEKVFKKPKKSNDESFVNISIINDENEPNDLNRSNISQTINSNLNFKEDIDDWNFYDEENKRISDKEMDKFNPVQRVAKVNKKPQIENMTIIKCNVANIENEENKKKNKNFKKIEEDSILKNNNENSTISLNKNKIHNISLNDIHPRNNLIEKISGISELNKDNEYKVTNNKLILDYNSNNSKIENFNSEYNLENVEIHISNNDFKSKKSEINDQSINNSNSIIYLSDNNFPGFQENSENKVAEVQIPKKTKKPKYFKKNFDFKKQDQAKNIIFPKKIEEKTELEDIKKTHMEKLLEENLFNNSKIKIKDDNLYDSEINKIKKIEKEERRFSRLDLSGDWNEDEFEENIPIENKKGNSSKKMELVLSENEIGDYDYNQSDNIINNSIGKSHKSNKFENERLNLSYNSLNKSIEETNLEEKKNSKKIIIQNDKKIESLLKIKDFTVFKNYKKINLPDLDDLREKRKNTKKDNLNSSKFEDLEINQNHQILPKDEKFKNLNESQNGLNQSSNNTLNMSKNKRRYYEEEDEFDFEEKGPKVFTKEQMKKPKVLDFIQKMKKDKISDNQQYYSNIQLNTKESLEMRTNKKRINNSVNFEQTHLENPHNIHLDCLNDQEYESIYDKKNKSFNIIGENQSDLSNSAISGGWMSPINSRNEQFDFDEDNLFIENQNEINFDYKKKEKLSENTIKSINSNINEKIYKKEKLNSKVGNRSFHQDDLMDFDDDFSAQTKVSKIININKEINLTNKNLKDSPKKIPSYSKVESKDNEIKKKLKPEGNKIINFNKPLKNSEIIQNIQLKIPEDKNQAKTYIQEIIPEGPIIPINTVIKKDLKDNLLQRNNNIENSIVSHEEEYSFSFHRNDDFLLREENPDNLKNLSNYPGDRKNLENMFKCESNDNFQNNQKETLVELINQSGLKSQKNHKNASVKMELNNNENIQNLQFDNFSLGKNNGINNGHSDQKENLRNRVFGNKVSKSNNVIKNTLMDKKKEMFDDLTDDW